MIVSVSFFTLKAIDDVELFFFTHHEERTRRKKEQKKE